MKTEPSIKVIKKSVKLIKKEERKGTESQAKLESEDGSAGWSSEVKSWVCQFQKNRSSESLATFDSLFK